MATRIRWGILGTGNIARQFAQGLRFLPEAELLAVGSRTYTTAQEFSQQLSIPRAYQSYEDLVNDKDIDVVYIATPHSRHKHDCMLCLEAGKPILCEKPFMINAREAREVIALARHKRLFCMEAMWMRCIPLIQKVRTMIHEGIIGDIRMLMADFGFAAERNPKSRFFNPELGGGALLDLGIYPLSLAFALLGPPAHVVSRLAVGPTGVDEQTAILLSYSLGQLALLSASLSTQTPQEAIIMGTQGYIRIHAPFYRPRKLSIATFSEVPFSSGIQSGLLASVKHLPFVQQLYFRFEPYIDRMRRRGPRQVVQSFKGNGYNYEADEVMSCLRRGALESQIMSLDETVRIMETMDTIRHQGNFAYPHE